MNYAQSRINMVDSQIHTGGVVDEAILEAYRSVPRELFVRPGQEGIAYNDEDLPLGGGRYLMEPLIHARLMQAVLPRPVDTVLDIGGATGYSAAVLARLAGSVTALECSSELLAHAWDKWRAMGTRNI